MYRNNIAKSSKRISPKKEEAEFSPIWTEKKSFKSLKNPKMSFIESDCRRVWLVAYGREFN